MSKNLEYTVVKVNDFLKVKPSGKLDLEETQSILNSVADLIACSDNNKILLDTREAFPIVHLTVFDVYGFVDELVKRRTAFKNKVAVLTRPDYQFDRAEFFELCAKNRGFQVEVFTNFENAIEWFSQTSIYNAPQNTIV